jgi:hypothetical protein
VAHRDEYKAVTAKHYGVQVGFRCTSIAVQLMTFLQDCLRTHILTVDQRYSDALSTKGALKTVFTVWHRCYDCRKGYGPSVPGPPHSSVAQWQSIRLLTGGL